jgi:hypothetical protein
MVAVGVRIKITCSMPQSFLIAVGILEVIGYLRLWFLLNHP